MSKDLRFQTFTRLDDYEAHIAKLEALGAEDLETAIVGLRNTSQAIRQAAWTYAHQARAAALAARADKAAHDLGDVGPRKPRFPGYTGQSNTKPVG